MYHLFQNSIWKVVKIAKTSDWKSAVTSQTTATVGAPLLFIAAGLLTQKTHKSRRSALLDKDNRYCNLAKYVVWDIQ